MDAVARTPRVRHAAAAAALVALSCGLLIGFHVGGRRPTLWVDDLATALAALASTVGCVAAARHHRGQMRRFWGLLGAACGAWTVAETIWAVYDLVLKVSVPVPSWADLGYLSAIPLAVAALVSHPALKEGAARRTRATFDALVLATAVGFVSWSFVLGPLWRHTDLTTLGGVVAVAYPFGDIVMLSLALLVVRGLPPRNRVGVGFVLGGVVAMAVSDSTYTYLTEIKTYASGNLIDVGWIVAYLALAVGACAATQEIPVAAHERHLEPGLLSMAAPYLVPLVALGCLAAELQLGRRLDVVDWLFALAMVLLVVTRQATLLVDGLRARSGSTGHRSQTLEALAGVTHSSGAGPR